MRGLTAAVAALVIATLACSGGGGSNDSGATGGTGGATNATCQDMRICVRDCADEACIAGCKARGTADAQAAFQALADCTTDPARGNCTTILERNCMCEAQCLMDPPCTDLVAACTGNIADTICDETCH